MPENVLSWPKYIHQKDYCSHYTDAHAYTLSLALLSMEAQLFSPNEQRAKSTTSYTQSSVLRCGIPALGKRVKAIYTHAGDVVVGADALLEKTVPDFPGEDRGTLALVEGYLADYLGGGHSGLAATDGPRPYRARLVLNLYNNRLKQL
ncbi:hypothetical protein TSAR_005936 [Trichomalopsis sarcophagae]|uniref:Uncharacterized protein n=1 Tax=Trichomalopsis sarcophagae TaxID=543379 RepID=A0A232F091_9HYME|nr:hypothetical protein TSAR_005936 [Trichomalopsis sarcophagae]